ncbi:hypothetical protein [Lacticaseibacillus sp. N501-2]|uniref:hypothetical protein n=1 Tax=Lacticaseibacillus salsurae TaxID=3367729 RepID=UPI0038B3710B
MDELTENEKDFAAFIMATILQDRQTGAGLLVLMKPAVTTKVLNSIYRSLTEKSKSQMRAALLIDHIENDADDDTSLELFRPDLLQGVQHAASH